MKVMPNRLDRGFSLYQAEFEKKALDVLRSGLAGRCSVLRRNLHSTWT